MSEIELSEHYNRMDKVIQIYLAGENNPTKIAERTGLQRKEVLQYLDEFRELAHSDEGLKARAKEALGAVDAHYSMLIKELWNTVTQIDSQGGNEIKHKTAALKAIADIEKQRVEMLQKAGMISDSELGDELAENQRKQEVLVKILREVTNQCEHCRIEVRKRLSEWSGKAEEVVVGEVM